jgi:hypothetical protein
VPHLAAVTRKPAGRTADKLSPAQAAGGGPWAEMLNARPAVRQLRETRARMSGRSSGPAPIQRYANVNGAKVSANAGLCMVGPQELYAGDDQFEQANGIPGHVAFAPGNQIPGGYVDAQQQGNLHRVVTSLKPDFQVAGSFYRTGADGSVAYPTAEDIAESGASLNAARDDEGQFNQANRQQYDQLQQGLAGPLLPSNCLEAARFVSGIGATQEDDAAMPGPGSVYEFLPGPQDAEWSFHYAGIVMADDADHVTMENAGAKASQNFSKDLMDKSWFYRMYGPDVGQSFEEAYQADLPGGAARLLRPADAPDDEQDDAGDQAPLLGDDEGYGICDAASALWRGLTSCFGGGDGD